MKYLTWYGVKVLQAQFLAQEQTWRVTWQSQRRTREWTFWDGKGPFKGFFAYPDRKIIFVGDKCHNSNMAFTGKEKEAVYWQEECSQLSACSSQSEGPFTSWWREFETCFTTGRCRQSGIVYFADVLPVSFLCDNHENEREIPAA